MGFGQSKPVIEDEEQKMFFQFYKGFLEHFDIVYAWENKDGDDRTFYLNIEENLNGTYVDNNRIVLCSFVTKTVGDTLYIKNFVYNLDIKTAVLKLAVGALNTFLRSNSDFKNIVYSEFSTCKSLTAQVFNDLNFYLVKNPEIILQIKSDITDSDKYIFYKKR